MQPQADPNCVFCKIIAGDIPSATVYEDDTSIVFLDINQAARGHLLITPRLHAEQWHHLDAETAAHLCTLAIRCAPAVLDALEADGYNLLQNNGAAAGQEVMHVHLHLIPRWRGDGYFGGGPKHRTANTDELRSTAQLIKTSMASSED